MAVLVSLLAYYLETEAQEKRTIDAVTERMNGAQTAFSRVSGEVVEAASYATDKTLSHSLFQNLLGRLNSGDVHSRWLWAPYVPAGELQKHESDTALLLKRSSYSVRKFGNSGPYLFPITIDTRSNGRDVIGLDAMSFPVIASVANSAPKFNITVPIYPSEKISRDRFGEDMILLAQFVAPANSASSATPAGMIMRGLSATDFAAFFELHDGQSFLVTDITDNSPVSIIGTASDLSNALFDSVVLTVADRKWQISIAREPASPYFPVWPIIAAVILLGTLLITALRAGSSVGLRADRLFSQLNRTEYELAETRNVQQAFFNNAGTANCETDVISGRFLSINDAMCELLGYSREELMQKSFADVTHPDDIALSQGKFRDEGGKPFTAMQFEKRYVRKDGSTIWALVNGRLVSDADGEPRSYATVVINISERKRDEQIKANLVRELAHRVRNTVQLTASLARQTARNARSVKEYDDRFRLRLTALNAAQDLLFETEWRGANLLALARRTLQPFQAPAEKDNAPEVISIDLPSAELPTQHAQTLAIAFHELGSNSMRFGALAAGGHVTLEGNIAEEEMAGKTRKVLNMRWVENGGGSIRKPRKSGFGMMMLTKALPEQYGGTAELSWTRTGFTYSCRLPLPEQ